MNVSSYLQNTIDSLTEARPAASFGLSQGPSVSGSSTANGDIQPMSFKNSKFKKTKAIDHFLYNWKPELEFKIGDSAAERKQKMEDKGLAISFLNFGARMCVGQIKKGIEQDQLLQKGYTWKHIPLEMKLRYATQLEQSVAAQGIPLARCTNNWAALIFLREAFENSIKEKVCN